MTNAFATSDLIAAGSEGQLSSGSASRRARVRLKEQIAYKHDYDSSSKANKVAKLEYWNMEEQDEESPPPKLPQKLSKIESRSRRDSIQTLPKDATPVPAPKKKEPEAPPRPLNSKELKLQQRAEEREFRRFMEEYEGKLKEC